MKATLKLPAIKRDVAGGKTKGKNKMIFRGNPSERNTERSMEKS